MIDTRNLTIIDNLMKSITGNWVSNDDFLLYLSLCFKEYINSLKILDGEIQKLLQDNTEIIVNLSAQILESARLYLQGKTMQSYESMKKGFSFIHEILLRKSMRRPHTTVEFGFKARNINDNSPNPTKKDMFHIPFELRHKVGNNRYSMHGIPSIYLGHSIYDCYLELGKPPLENFWVSLFCFSQNNIEYSLSSKQINLIDLTVQNKFYKLNYILHSTLNDEEKLQETINEIVDDILLLPLIIACSVSCKYPNDPFKQEYIIPQILYQLCQSDSEYIGIRYFSTKISNELKYDVGNAFINYALPAQNITSKGYCSKLASQLVLTEPISTKVGKELTLDSKYGFTQNGLPILSNLKSNLKIDETIITFDKMTMYYDNILNSFINKEDITAISPIYGWK